MYICICFFFSTRSHIVELLFRFLIAAVTVKKFIEWKLSDLEEQAISRQIAQSRYRNDSSSKFIPFFHLPLSLPLFLSFFSFSLSLYPTHLLCTRTLSSIHTHIHRRQIHFDNSQSICDDTSAYLLATYLSTSMHILSFPLWTSSLFSLYS